MNRMKFDIQTNSQHFLEAMEVIEACDSLFSPSYNCPESLVNDSKDTKSWYLKRLFYFL